MSDLKLSAFLQRVLTALKDYGLAVSVDASGHPDPEVVLILAERLNEEIHDVAAAIEGLRIADCLVEEVVEFDGAQPLSWWLVHPQC